jgi:hypothetical protein
MPPDDLAAPHRVPSIAGLSDWTSCVPAAPGVYELWDPTLRVHLFVRVVQARRGGVAALNRCACALAFRIDLWCAPGFHAARWRGPLEVPASLPPEDDVAWRVPSPFGSRGGHGRPGRPCLLGILCPIAPSRRVP